MNHGLQPHEYPLTPRLKRIQQIYVRHAGIENANEMVNYTWDHGLRLKEAATSVLVGHSRCGKSETLKRFITKKSLTPEKPFLKAGPSGSALIKTNEGGILFLDTTNGGTPLSASTSILGSTLMVPRAHRFGEHEAAQKLLEAFEIHDVKMLIIDEAQQMFRNHGRYAVAKFASWLLTLENSGQVRILISGSPYMHLLFQEETFTYRKSAMKELLPFAYKTKEEKSDFAKFAADFDAQLPFLETPLSDAANIDRFFFATRGRVGSMAKLFETATTLATPSDGTPPASLTMDDLAKGFKMLWGQADIMSGVNPFSPNATLPTYPLNLEEEGQSPPPTSPKPRGRQRGSMLRDD